MASMSNDPDSGDMDSPLFLLRRPPGFGLENLDPTGKKKKIYVLGLTEKMIYTITNNMSMLNILTPIL